MIFFRTPLINRKVKHYLVNAAELHSAFMKLLGSYVFFFKSLSLSWGNLTKNRYITGNLLTYTWVTLELKCGDAKEFSLL